MYHAMDQHQETENIPHIVQLYLQIYEQLGKREIMKGIEITDRYHALKS
jgi:hypothetical protein